MTSNPHDRGRKFAASTGLTLVELVISMTLLVGLVAVVMNITLSVNTSQSLTKGILSTSEAGRNVLDELRKELGATVFTPLNTTRGNAYFNLLDISGGPQPIATTRLPKQLSDGPFRKEGAGEDSTGNALCFARQERTDVFRCTSGTSYRVPIYRFHLLYLTKLGKGPMRGVVHGLDLCHWISEETADGHRIDRISDPIDRTEVLMHLHDGTADTHGATHRPIQVVWKVGAELTTADTLRSITDTGDLADSPPDDRTAWRLLRRPDLATVELFKKNNLSVATNHAPDRFGVSRFALRDDTGIGFPHGFEIQIAGAGSARKILVNLSVTQRKHGMNRVFFRQHVVASTPRGATL